MWQLSRLGRVAPTLHTAFYAGARLYFCIVVVACEGVYSDFLSIPSLFVPLACDNHRSHAIAGIIYCLIPTDLVPMLAFCADLHKRKASAFLCICCQSLQVRGSVPEDAKRWILCEDTDLPVWDG